MAGGAGGSGGGFIGRTLYVAPTGNDATSYANNSPTSPWRTLRRATFGGDTWDLGNPAQAVQPGDRVLVAAGTYDVDGSNARTTPAFLSINSGTAQAPIIFEAQGQVVVQLRSGVGPVIGCYRRDYLTWRGFTVRETTAFPSTPDTGPVVFFLSRGCVLEGSDVDGNGTGHGQMDNHPAIRIEASDETILRGNRVHNNYTVANVFNGACIQTYSSQGFVIERNWLHDCGAGVFVKGGPFTAAITRSSFIRRNLITNTGEVRLGQTIGGCLAFHAGAPYSPTAPLIVTQNVMRNCGQYPVRFWSFDGTNPLNNPSNIWFVNNTITGTAESTIHVSGNGSGQMLPNSGLHVWNNVLAATSQYGIAFGATVANLTKANFDVEHNVYFGATSMATEWSGTNFTLAAWRSMFGQDVAAPQSIVADPAFVSPTDVHLQASSPARGLGVDVLDLDGDSNTTELIPAGAYVSGTELIGP